MVLSPEVVAAILGALVALLSAIEKIISLIHAGA